MNIKRILLLVTILIASTTACDTLPGVEWPDAVTCGTEVADGLLSEVNAVLDDDTGPVMGAVAESRLADLAIKHGTDAVACLVDRVLERWTHPMATMTPERADAIKRAQGWQAKTGTKVAR